jgi:hypothetical protein
LESTFRISSDELHLEPSAEKVQSDARSGDDGNKGSVVGLFAELNNTIGQSVQGIILADADIQSGVVLRATLANDDVARNALLSTEDFHTQSLGVRFPPVFRATYTFFVSHGFGDLRFDVRDFQFCQGSTEAVHLLMSFPTLLLEDQNFVAFEVAFNLGGHLRAAYRWGANLNVSPLVDEQN